MLMIRLQRVGRKNDPAFRVILTEKRARPKTSGIERLGSFHPKTKHVVLKNDRILYWLSKGAHVSPTVHNILVTKGVITGKKLPVVRQKSSAAASKEAPAPTAAVTQESVDKNP